MTVVFANGETLAPASTMEQLRAEEAEMAGRSHREQAEFYRARVQAADPRLNMQQAAALASYHASMALLEAITDA